MFLLDEKSNCVCQMVTIIHIKRLFETEHFDFFSKSKTIQQLSMCRLTPLRYICIFKTLDLLCHLMLPAVFHRLLVTGQDECISERCWDRTATRSNSQDTQKVKKESVCECQQ